MDADVAVINADVTVAGAMGQRLEESSPNHAKILCANLFFVLILLISKNFLT